MDTSSRKTSLVVLFNHQYERNIPVIRELYSRRFSGLLQLMPYYKEMPLTYVPSSEFFPVL